MGWFTPTEAAVVAVFYGLFVGMVIHRTIGVRDLFPILREAGELSAVILLVVALEEENKTLAEQNSKLESQVTEQAEEIQILSDTVSQKVQSENELSATLEKQSLPTEFPLTGSASMEEVTEGEPMCIFHASVGTTVVAAASGTVMAVNDDETYGHSVWVDHGNGYITIYRNKGDATVAVGDSVVQGTTLFVIGEDNADLGYQMQKDGSYINPIDMLAISG
jgi:septal ring factor EnvC (AmiA/AmiB activator)